MPKSLLNPEWLKYIPFVAAALLFASDLPVWLRLVIWIIITVGVLLLIGYLRMPKCKYCQEKIYNEKISICPSCGKKWK